MLTSISSGFRVSRRFSSLLLLFGLAGVSPAAAADRVTRPVDVRQIHTVPGSVHRLALPEFDQGSVEDSMPMDFMVLLFKPSAPQQADLDRLLASQQNPSSPEFHKWLIPEEFAGRFGVSTGDHSKVAAWLNSEGFRVNQLARGRNWIAFSGKAAQVAKTFHTPIHRFRVNGESHYANTADISVPAALADVVGGFIGLDDFRLASHARLATPEYSAGGSHYLTPEDFATIYNLTPLYQAGFDGAGQSIAVVGESSVLLSDLRAFRTRYNLPANDPKMVPYSGVDPGFNGAQLEGNLDLEWAGAIAPKATIYYVYGANAFTAIVSAVDANLAPILSVSYGGCEVGFVQPAWRAVMQQANAQGVTILSSSGDGGAAGCDPFPVTYRATQGLMVDFPAVLPEVTAVGGTRFVEGAGAYWSSTNSANFGSALSYIPETAWNDLGLTGIMGTGGGASLFIPKPAWQTGIGVPDDHARDVPDVSLSASSHDSYYITYQGANGGVYGTSCSAPAMAGIVALLNHYQIVKGFQKKPGLGNINPQLYRLAQSAPSVFHDIISGDNIVSCAQNSPDCLTGSYGYRAGVGYDQATGLGSVDANSLITQWNTKTNAVVVTFTASPSKGSLNDTAQLTATVTAASGTSAPTGSVDFNADGLSLGSVQLTGTPPTAGLTLPLSLLGGTGPSPLVASYSGDAAFSGGSANATVQVTLPSAGAAVIPVWRDTIWPSLPPDAQGPTWQTPLSLREVAGVATSITSFTIDGKSQPVLQYFPAGAILPNGTATTSVVFRNLAAPLVRTFGFAGADATGRSWSRQVSVTYLPLPLSMNFNLTATPLTVVRNPAADPSCQWSVQLTVDELGGARSVITSLFVGSVDLTSQISAVFGSPRLDAWGSTRGTLCLSDITPPATDFIWVTLNQAITQQVAVSFLPAPENPVMLSSSPAAINLATADAHQPVQTTLSVDISDKSQAWTATILPSNRTTAWLSASQLAGTGPGQIILKADGSGFQPGVYRASIVIQSRDALPQTLTAPVMFVSGGSYSGTAITGVASAASTGTTGGPGMLLSVFGTKLANSVKSGASMLGPVDGVSATVNGIPAFMTYISPVQINLQIPYEAGGGPAVVGIDNNGQIAGFAFPIEPAMPSVFADAAGNIVPAVAVSPGSVATLFLTGVGEISPLINSGSAPGGSPSSLPKPVLPLTVTVGGIPALVQYAAGVPGALGTFQVNFTVPGQVSAGIQPVVVTVGGKASPPVNLNVVAPGSEAQ